MISAPIQEPHVALIIDTSGSMRALEYALGPIAWIITDGLRQIGGRCAIALFGSSAELLTDGTQRLRHVPAIRTGGGTAFAGDALDTRHRPARDDQPAPTPLHLHPVGRRAPGRRLIEALL